MALLTYSAAAIFSLIGVLHLGFALYDFSAQPRYFRPHDESMLDAMKYTHVEIAGEGRDFWTSVIGTHLCHAIGVLLFALLIVLERSYDIVAMRPLLALIAVAYCFIAWRFWSRRPLSASLIGTIVLFGSWIG